MKLQISFEPAIDKLSVSRLVLSVGDAFIRSYPMSVDDHYRDLVAIRSFLDQRRLSSLFFGDEPVAEVELSSESDLVKLTPYSGPGQKTVSGVFDLNQGLSQIECILDELTAIISADKECLDEQVAADVDAGVYDVYLNNRHPSG